MTVDIVFGSAASRIMYQEALDRGYECEVLSDNNTILMKHNGLWWYTRGTRTSLQSSVGKTIADDKVLTKDILARVKAPFARYVRVSDKNELERVRELKFPVVMKPVGGMHGKGVVVGISDYEEVEKIYEEVGGEVMFEETLEGNEYRVVCVDYKMAAAALRKPAFVMGDGKYSLKELIEMKNADPQRGEEHHNALVKIEVDKGLLKTLTQQGLELESVVEAGREVRLKGTANLSTGGETWDVTHEVSQENKELFEAIAKTADLNVVGIDVMSDNLQVPLISQTKAGIIEINASPGLRIHHNPTKGEFLNVAGMILDMVVEKLSEGKYGD